MRLPAFLALLLTAGTAFPACAQGPSLPPHAWLFGTWTGGLFPVTGRMSPQACFSQPIVIFTRDLVMRTTLIEQEMTQRVIESARAAKGGVELRFAAAPPRPTVLGGSAPAAGFGCESPDVLHVQRRGENEISFPGCSDFPNPLVRCQTR